MPAGGQRPAKDCASCGRRFERRSKWADEWDRVRYCSASCRRRRIAPVDRSLQDAILELLASRSSGGSICPSEAARLVAERADHEPDGWRDLMEPARRAARRLVAAGEVELTQRGRVVDPSRARGPIRIRTRRR